MLLYRKHIYHLLVIRIMNAANWTRDEIVLYAIRNRVHGPDAQGNKTV